METEYLRLPTEPDGPMPYIYPSYPIDVGGVAGWCNWGPGGRRYAIETADIMAEDWIATKPTSHDGGGGITDIAHSVSYP